MQRWFALIAAILFAGCTAVTPADAQGTTNDEPPLIAGRVALVEGDAQIWRVEEASTGQWDAAMVNDVVTVGTGLFIGNDGRYEVRVGPNSYRLGPSSRGGFSQLDYTGAVFNLEYGTLNVRLARPEHGETTAVTVAGVRVELVAPGRYRIDATENGPMRLTVFEGHGTVRGPGNALGVAAGQALAVNPGGAGFSFEQPVATAFDQWALARDQRYAQVGASTYVSPYMTGYEDLGAYGDWVTEPTYGAVWYPRAVPTGWAPYRYGQWRWVPPWGWTWVDAAPWGYAPFHYGRWVMIGPRWCWVPGGYVRRPVWAPALVGFVGGATVSVGVGPTVGWYPLAPWHRYEPHYRHNTTYVTVINQTIINRPPPGVPPTINQGPGATIVPGGRFREPINRVVLPVQPRPEQLKPAPPPPLNVAPAPRSHTPRYADNDGRPTTPPTVPNARVAPPGQAPVQPQPVPPPTRVMPPPTAQPMPGRGATPPLPGNDPRPLEQPQPRVPKPVTPPPAPAPGTVVPPPERPAPRPRFPSDPMPPANVNPAEPPRVPPQAPPTVRQPSPMAPAARPVQPSPAQLPAPAPAARPVQPSPAPAPAAAAPAAPAHGPAAPPAAQPKPHPEQSQRDQAPRGRPEAREPQRPREVEK